MKYARSREMLQINRFLKCTFNTTIHVDFCKPMGNVDMV